MNSVDFARAPFLVIWETTQACALACRHCRASARPWRDPLELTREEGERLIADKTCQCCTLQLTIARRDGFDGGEQPRRQIPRAT